MSFKMQTLNKSTDFDVMSFNLIFIIIFYPEFIFNFFKQSITAKYCKNMRNQLVHI